MTQLTAARLALQNADLAYRFHAAEADREQAERWWARRCYWQELVQELELKEKPTAGGFVQGASFRTFG